MNYEESISAKARAFLSWLPLLYLITVAGFHFDGWYHTVVGRDEFWIAPHIFIILGQSIHTIVAYVLMRMHRNHEKNFLFFRKYLFIQLLFFIGLSFDEWWHRIIGEETIDTPLVFWGPPHFVIAASLLISPFFVGRMIVDTFKGSQKTTLFALTFGSLLAFINFYFYPLWPLGPFRVIGFYGEIVMMAALGFVLFWALKHISVTLSASLLTLIFLSLAEIMSWGSFADVPRVHELFGAPAYPFWLTFFSFFLAAVFLDVGKSFLKRSPVFAGIWWGGVQASLYYIGAKLWVGLSPKSVFEGWQYFPGIILSWENVFVLAVLGSLGGLIGFSAAEYGLQMVQQKKIYEWKYFQGVIKTLSLVFFIGILLWLLFSIYQFSSSSSARTKNFVLRSSETTLALGEERYTYNRFVIPEDMYLFEIIPEPEGEGNLLHHVILSYGGEQDGFYFCPKMNQGIFSAGSELVGLSLPPPYGFAVKKGQMLFMETHLANEARGAIRGSIFLKIAGRKEGIPVSPLHLVAGIPFDGFCHVGSERVLSYDIPQEATLHEATLEKPFEILRSGSLLYWGGHFHEYGAAIQFFHNGTLIQELKPRENPIMQAQGRSVYLGGLFLSPPLEVKKGDTINIKAIYKKPQGLGIRGAMGISYVIFDYNEKP